MSDLEDDRSHPDSEGSGDDTRPYGDPDNSDEEEEEEGIEEMNEEDKRFIVDEDEDEEEPADDQDGPVLKKRKKKKRKVVDEEEDFDDDLELVAENTGQVYQRENKFKRLKQGRVEEARIERNDDLSRMFDEVEASTTLDFQEDDLNDFIEDDEEDDIETHITAPASAPRPARRREERDAGIHDEAYDEVFDIFGGGEDYSFALLRPEEMQQDIAETKLEDVFEPSELVERMLTERDEQIRITDLPERLQLQLGPDTDPRYSDEDIEEEIVWMAPHILNITGQRDTSEPLYNALRHILRFMTQENLEIPYIRMHCQDYYTEHHRSGSRHNTFTIAGQDLWEVHDLHFQWRSIHDRQQALRALYAKLDIEDAYFNDQMARADKMDDLEDLTEYLQMQYADQILRAKKEVGYKRPTKVSNFEAVKKTPIYEFTKKFGLSVKDFGTNLLQGNRLFFTEDDNIPEEVAAAYVSSQFPTTEMVLKIAKSVVAQEIGIDPQMRKAFRIVYEHKATISVFPTEKGSTRIDAHHPYYAFKYLNNKPITAFHDGQFLEILKSEAEGLTHVRVLHQNEDKFIDIMHKLYLSDAYSASAEQWNEIRRDVLNTALTEYLRPMAEKWVKEKLRKEAEKRIAREIQLNLETKLNIAPYRTPRMEPDGVPRVLAMTWGNGEFAKDAVNMVLMDTDGRVRDTLKVNTLREAECSEMFSALVDEWKPDVIGIAGLHSVSTRRLHEQVERICTEGRSSGIISCEPTIMIVNDEVARLYYNAKRAVEEFRQFSPLMRYAVALARRLQSPVHEYAALGKDIIHIRHHRLQNLLREDTLITFTERALINIINQLGVDINEVIANPYKAHALQYVCGLGLRKAQGFLKRINATGEPLESRAELITRKIATKCIFLNCASFLKIRPYVEVLDDTRIHPQDYQLARKMAADALDMEDEDISQYDTPSQLVLDLIKNDEDKLDVLDLDEYADTLEAQIRTPKRMTLLHIKHELQAPYKDTRYPYPYPTADESFALITGETDRTFRPGAIVPVVITKVRERSASARLDNGLDGIITIQNMADHRINDPSEVLQVGQTVRCQIVAIDKIKFLVDLSCLPFMVQAGDTATMTQRDQYFDDYEEEQEKNTEINNRKSRHRSTRVIQHPAFRPMNGKEAEQYLAGRPRGEFVVRPSSRGNDHIAVTWKVDEGIYQHIDVVELEKENEFALGKILKVGQATYDDLDELIALHVENMSRKVDEMMVHPKFRKGDIRDMYEFLAATSMANPRLAVYSFCLNPEHPGTFNLAFKINAQNEPKKWIVRVTPNSYRLGDHDYPDVNSLINGFKKLQMAGTQRKPHGPTTMSSAPKSLPPQNQPQPPPPNQYYQAYPQPQYHQPDVPKSTTIPPWRR